MWGWFCACKDKLLSDVYSQRHASIWRMVLRSTWMLVTWTTVKRLSFKYSSWLSFQSPHGTTKLLLMWAGGSVGGVPLLSLSLIPKWSITALHSHPHYWWVCLHPCMWPLRPANWAVPHKHACAHIHTNSGACSLVYEGFSTFSIILSLLMFCNCIQA